MSPEGVLRGHPPDESPQLTREAGPPASRSSSGPPAPGGRPPPAMPAEHGRGLHDEEGLSPAGHPATSENPEPAVAGTQPEAWRPALQHDHLLTQAQILGDQVRSGCEPCRDRPPRPPDHAEPPSLLALTGSLSQARAEGKDGGWSSCALQLRCASPLPSFRALRFPMPHGSSPNVPRAGRGRRRRIGPVTLSRHEVARCAASGTDAAKPGHPNEAWVHPVPTPEGALPSGTPRGRV